MQCPACKREAWKEVGKKVDTPHGEKEVFILLCELGHWWYDTKVNYVPARS